MSIVYEGNGGILEISAENSKLWKEVLLNCSTMTAFSQMTLHSYLLSIMDAM